ncbi:MAG: hypothetical protein ACRBN8_02195 [Nannocystales bacterium]
MSARANLEIELGALRRQRLSYLNAAYATGDRGLAMRRLRVVERLQEEIEALEHRLMSMDDSTQPICLDTSVTR